MRNTNSFVRGFDQLPEFISRRGAARLLGLRTSRVNELIETGDLVLIPEGKRGKLAKRNIFDFVKKRVGLVQSDEAIGNTARP